MSIYLLVHRHPHGYTGSREAAAVWEAWFGKLGDALVDKGNAVLGGRSVTGEAGTVLPPRRVRDRRRRGPRRSDQAGERLPGLAGGRRG